MFPLQYSNLANPPFSSSVMASNNRNRTQQFNSKNKHDALPLQVGPNQRISEAPHHELNDSQRSRVFRMQQERLRSYSRSTSQRSTDADAFIQDIIKKEDIIKSSDIVKTIPSESQCVFQRSVVPATTHHEVLSQQEIHSFGFPQWCYVKANLPVLYTTVEKLATREGHLDTGLLYPLLLSSGLHKTVLGHIWYLVNQSVPGMLQPHELYAALALIALAQKGSTCNRLDVLHTFSTPPVPFLQLPTNPDASSSFSFISDITSTYLQPVEHHPPQRSANISSNEYISSVGNLGKTSETNDDEFAEFLSGPTSNLPPATSTNTVTPTGSSAVGSRLANYSKSLTKIAASSSSLLQLNDSNQSDEEFAEFQHAKEHTETCSTDTATISDGGRTILDSTIGENSSEDKYSVFRELDQELHEKNAKAQNDIEFGDFLTNTEAKDSSTQFQNTDNQDVGLLPSCIITEEWDVLGSKKPLEKELDQFTSEMSFNLLKKQAAVHSIQMDFFSKDDDNEEFGDFVSPIEIRDELFPSPKDCFIENQSVSSLEFSPVENIMLEGEALNDSTSYGSLSSLDKITNEVFDFPQPSDGPDTDLSSKSFSQSEGINVIPESADKGMYSNLERYSFINKELSSEYERNLREWKTCLENCQQLINDAHTIFKDISCQSVCNEVIESEEGQNYIKNITEIYKLVLRIHSTVKVTDSEDNDVKSLFSEIDATWQVIGEILPLTVEKDDYNTTVENAESLCGVCLKTVNKVSSLHDGNKLTYGGRQYHTTCANFWVNRVNSLLPALTFSQLL